MKAIEIALLTCALLLGPAVAEAGEPTYRVIAPSGDYSVLWGKHGTLEFSEDLAPVQIGDKWGHIDRDGNFVVPPLFDLALAFREGLALVATDAEWAHGPPPYYKWLLYDLPDRRCIHRAKWGFVDKHGAVVIKPQFDEATSFSDGRAIVRKGRKLAYIDKTGKLATRLMFDDAEDFSAGLAAVRMGDKWGFIDKTGKLVIRPQFSRAWSFSEGLAPVSKDGASFYIDRTGKTVINKLAGIEPDITFHYSAHFSEGVAAVGWDIVSRAGLGTISRHSTRNVYIDKSGKLAIPPKFRVRGFYSSAGAFSEGLAAVRLERGKHFGYIDKTGTFVIKPQFPDAEAFSEGWAKVATDGKCAFIDKTGKVVLKLDYRFWRVSSFRNGAARVEQDDGRMGYIDKTGKFIWKPTK